MAWLPLLVTLALLFEFSLRGAPEVPSQAVAEVQKAVDHFRKQQYDQAVAVLRGLEQRYPDCFDIQQLLAITLEMRGNREEAHRHFQKAVELDPRSVIARSNLGTSLMRLGRTPEAISQFEAVLRIDPDNPTAHFNLGRIFLGQNEFQKALPWLEKAYERQPEVYENGYQLAFCHFALGNHGDVRKILNALQPEPKDGIGFRLLRALNEKETGNSGGAQRASEELLPLLPGASPEAYDQLVSLLLSRKRFQEALPLLQAAADHLPKSHPALLKVAAIEMQVGKLAEARQHASQALALQETAEAHVLMGDILETSDDSLAAVEHYQRAVTLDPSEDNLYALAYLFLSHWNWEAAEQVFESALRRFPASGRLWLGLGVAFLGQSENEKATGAFLQSTEIWPDELMGYHFLAQTFSLSPGLIDRAAARFQEFYKDQPENAWAAYYYALSLYRRDAAENGTGAHCIDLLQRLLQTHADFFEAHFLLGEIYFDQKQWHRALPALEKAVDLNSTHLEARYKLGLALHRNGQKERAREELRLYQELKQRQDAAVSQRMAQTKKFLVEMKKQ